MSDGERFVVTEATWDGTCLSAQFLMHSTAHVTVAKLEWIAPDTLRGEFMANSEPAGIEIWERLR